MKEFEALEFTWKAVIVMSFVILPVQLMMSAPYGRYLRAGYGFGVNFRLAWVLQECPSFLIPVFVAGYLGGDQITGALNPNTVLLLMFLLHYFQRYMLHYFECMLFHMSQSQIIYLSIYNSRRQANTIYCFLDGLCVLCHKWICTVKISSSLLFLQ